MSIVPCKNCGEPIDFKIGEDKKPHPVNPETGMPHRCMNKGQVKHDMDKSREEYNREAQKKAGFGAPAATTTTTTTTTKEIGMVDPAKILKVTMGVTINLHDYNNLKVEVEATDGNTAKKALIEILGVTIPAESAVSRECIDRYIKAVLIGGR